MLFVDIYTWCKTLIAISANGLYLQNDFKDISYQLQFSVGSPKKISFLQQNQGGTSDLKYLYYLHA